MAEPATGKFRIESAAAPGGPRKPGGGGSGKPVPAGLVALLVFCLAALLGLAAWLLLREPTPDPLPVVLEIEPVPERVFVGGESLEYTQGGEFFLIPGEHRIEVAVPGHALLDTVVEVRLAEVNEFAFQLSPLPGVLSITANAPARIWIDGDEVGETPLESIELPPGKHTLRLDGGEDFLPLEKEVTVEGRRKRQSVELELTRSWAWLNLESDPPGARVLDERDRLVGLAGQPIKVMARERPYAWTLSAGPAYEPQELEFTAEADEDLDLGRFELDLDHAEIVLRSDPPGLPIAMNGRMTGHVTPHRFSAPPNLEYVFALRSPAHEEVTRSVRPEPGREYVFEFEPTALKGDLRLVSLPPGAEVYAGKELLGNTPLELEYPAGERSFLFRRMGYLDKEASVRVRPGLNAELKVNLERNQ